MRKHLLTFIFLAPSLLAISQFSDNFSDGDFINTQNFINDIGNLQSVTLFELYLNNSTAERVEQILAH